MAAPTEFDVRAAMAKGLPYEVAKGMAETADPAAVTATTIAAATPAAAPAGGVGAAAGGWDTAANRDAAITTINGLRTQNIELVADFNALHADVAALRATVLALTNALQAAGLST